MPIVLRRCLRRSKKQKDRTASGLAPNWHSLAPSVIPLPASSRKAKATRTTETPTASDFFDGDDASERDLARRTTKSKLAAPRANTVRPLPFVEVCGPDRFCGPSLFKYVCPRARMTFTVPQHLKSEASPRQPGSISRTSSFHPSPKFTGGGSLFQRSRG